MRDLSRSLVVGVASSALFDLTESDEVFRQRGRDEYERYQQEHLDDVLAPGTAFPFVQRLLSLNSLGEDLIEVIVMSRNSARSGLRVMRSVKAHGLPITRAVFREGTSSYEFMPTLNMSLFLSANKQDVVAAVQAGHAAGHVLPSSAAAEPGDDGLRIAFDFDGVLASDASERRFQSGTFDEYTRYEHSNADVPLDPGPLAGFLAAINRIQQIEHEAVSSGKSRSARVRVSLVTARNAPAHERPIRSLEAWGVRVDDAFFLGGISKTGVLNTLRPHIFFDDQLQNLSDPGLVAPAVHIPFGIHNGPVLDC